MTLVALNKITAINVMGAAVPRSQLVFVGMQMYFRGKMNWSTKAIILRNPPHHVIDPVGAGAARWRAWTYIFGRLAQAYTRLVRGKVMAERAGRKVLPGTNLPAPAGIMMVLAHEVYRAIEGRLPERKRTFDVEFYERYHVVKYRSRRSPRTLDVAAEQLRAMGISPEELRAAAERAAEAVRAAGRLPTPR